MLLASDQPLMAELSRVMTPEARLVFLACNTGGGGEGDGWPRDVRATQSWVGIRFDEDSGEYFVTSGTNVGSEVPIRVCVNNPERCLPESTPLIFRIKSRCPLLS